MNKTLLLITAAVMFQGTSASRATTISSQEDMALHQICFAYVRFMHDHRRLPVGWNELESSNPDLKQSNELLKRTDGFTLPERYVFLSPPVPMVEGRGSSIVMARVAPFRRKLGGPPDWSAVVMMRDGDFGSGRFSVWQIQKSLEAANYQLVRPAGVPEVELVGSAKWTRIVLIVLTPLAILLCALIWGMRRTNKEPSAAS